MPARCGGGRWRRASAWRRRRSRRTSDLAVRIGQRRRPLHRVVAVVGFVLERVPLALRGVAPADVLDDDDVAAGGALHPEAAVTVLVVGRALQQHGVAARPPSAGRCQRAASRRRASSRARCVSKTTAMAPPAPGMEGESSRHSSEMPATVRDRCMTRSSTGEGSAAYRESTPAPGTPRAFTASIAIHGSRSCQRRRGWRLRWPQRGVVPEVAVILRRPGEFYGGPTTRGFAPRDFGGVLVLIQTVTLGIRTDSPSHPSAHRAAPGAGSEQSFCS